MADLGGSPNRRRFGLVVVSLFLLSPWIGFGALKALESGTNSPLDWVDDRFAPRADYDQFKEQFGAADVVVISWPDCTLDNARVDAFVHELRYGEGFFEQGDWLFHRVLSGRELFARLTGAPLSLTPAEAARRLTGSMLGRDGQTTSVIVAFNEQGLSQRGRLVPLIRAAANKIADADDASQHLAGPVMDGFWVDQASQQTLRRFAPLSSIIVLCVCVLCLNSLYAALLVFGIACVSQAIALAILHYSGGEMTALLIVLPPLVQVLAIGGGIHLVNYYLDAAKQTGPGNAAAAALQVGWLPCVLSAATTAIGLGSLAVSGLAAVGQFGIYAAIGVIATAATTLVLLSGALTWRPLKHPSPPNDRQRLRFWIALTRWQQRRGGLICAIALFTMIGLGLGIGRLKASVRIETLFGPESRLIHDYAWLEEHVGPLVPIETVVRFDESCELTTRQRIELLQKVGAHLRLQPGVQAVTSCLDFIPPALATARGHIAAQLMTLLQPAAQKSGFLADSGEDQQWRLTSHVSALGGQDYGSVLDSMQHSLDQELASGALSAGAHQGVTTRFSGLMPLVHEIQRQLLHDLFASFLTAFVLIAVVMTLVQAGLVVGLLSMVPNLFPALTLFGVLGWIGHPIDIGSIMTASVAMGIGVDDTLHFLTFYRRRLETVQSRSDAVLSAYQHCGRAMIQTTLICGAGLAIFAFSDFVPTARFAWMMVALLGAALVGDLIILPAILLSPLGKSFGTPGVTAVRNISDRARIDPPAQLSEPTTRPPVMKANLP
jgi:predicted RND superfamily exporter protein